MRFLLGVIFCLLVLVGPTMTYAQQTTTKSLFSNMTALSENIDSLGRHADSAMLHGNTTAQNMFNSQGNLLICITSILPPVNANVSGISGLDPLSSAFSGDCDETVTKDIVNHDLGNNQTILALAHQYLLTRGIK